MAYPFAPFPTFGTVKRRLAALGCEFKDLDSKVKNPEGDDIQFCYFERTDNDKLLLAECPRYSDDEPVTFTLVRSICARLKIKPRELDIGLDLD